MNILVTGGAGYVGSHVAVCLLQQGYRVVLLDNLSNSSECLLDRLDTIAGHHVPHIPGDVRDMDLLKWVLRKHSIGAVLHCAGLTAEHESLVNPMDYYTNDVLGTMGLLHAMQAASIKLLVFSSSAAVYGRPQYLPLDEDHPLGASHPFGRSRIDVEDMLGEMVLTDPDWHIACLRYFNPVGAHESGLIGDISPCGPENLMPYIAQVASGQRPALQIFGDDYQTSDGTGVRDYIHVMDLAKGHVAALRYLENHAGWHAFNLGTGRGYSVRSIVQSFEKVCGREIPCRVVARRSEDIPECYVDPSKTRRLLGWHAQRSLDDMCASAWNIQRTVVGLRNTGHASSRV